jgi:hypothetical protein
MIVIDRKRKWGEDGGYRFQPHTEAINAGGIGDKSEVLIQDIINTKKKLEEKAVSIIETVLIRHMAIHKRSQLGIDCDKSISLT